MPTYVIRGDAVTLPSAQRHELARRVTETHATVTGAPRSFAQVFVETVEPGTHFVGGEPAEAGTVFVHGHVRGGRPHEMLAELSTSLRDAVVEVTGVPQAAVWVYVSTLEPGWTVEFGQTLPAPGDEQQWRGALPDDVRDRLDALDGR